VVVVVLGVDSTIAPEGGIHTAPLLWGTLGAGVLAFVGGATKAGATTKGPGDTSTKALLAHGDWED
jgi:hypothetical protein